MSVGCSHALAAEAAHGSGTFGSRGLALVRGRGATVWDDMGRSYVDATSMYGVASLGHAHPEIVRALREQAATLGSCFGSWANDRRSELFTRLARLLQPLDRFFLCNSGTEAVEAALKLARLVTGRTRFVATRRGFHGRTLGALSVTHKPAFREPFAPLVPDVVHVPLDDTEALDAAIDDDVAAFIVEPIQGEGGVHPADPGFLQRAEATCRERGALFVVDEVQTGFCRTGRWFGFEHAALRPDAVCLAKGMAGGFPMGALAWNGALGTFQPGHHGSTFGGNPLACAAASATMRVMEDDDLAARAEALGAHVRQAIVGFDARRVRDVRGVGLMIAIELRQRAAPLQKQLQEAGALTLNAGPNALRLLPPLVITDEETERLLTILQEVLAS